MSPAAADGAARARRTSWGEPGPRSGEASRLAASTASSATQATKVSGPRPPAVVFRLGPGAEDVLVGAEVVRSAAGSTPRWSSSGPAAASSAGSSGGADGVGDLGGVAGVEEELQRGGGGEEAEVGGVEESGGGVLEVAGEQGGEQGVVLEVGDRGRRKPAGCEEAAVAAQDVSGVGQVLEDVAEEEAVEGGGLQGRVVRGGVEGEDAVEAVGGACGDRREALDAGDVASGVDQFQGGAEASLAAADLEDAEGVGWHGEEQGAVAAGVVVVGLGVVGHGRLGGVVRPGGRCPRPRQARRRARVRSGAGERPLSGTVAAVSTAPARPRRFSWRGWSRQWMLAIMKININLCT